MRERLGQLLRCVAVVVLCAISVGAARQHALDAAGPQAARVARLYWVFFGVAVVVYVGVMAWVLASVWRNRRRRSLVAAAEADVAAEGPLVGPDGRRERRMGRVVASLVAVTAVVLVVLVVSDFATGRGIHSMRAEQNPLVIRAVARQWWWEFRYPNPDDPSQEITTANEMHIPTGRTVRLLLESPDVIHSFWVPNLTGKKDMIPGHATSMWFSADKAGVYDGQCAEFCGLQHAKMRFQVVAESPEQFDAWCAAARRPATQPATMLAQRGQQVFLGSTCPMCHMIAGTEARGRVGPPLTHLMSRQRIAAGTLPNTKGHLGGWVIDPQSVKPGTRMPQHNFESADFHALLEYLTSLK